jgi:hypothetical protein
MLSRRGSSSLRVRAGTATLAFLLVTPLIMAAPAAAAGSGTSAIGDGARSSLRDFNALAGIGDPPGQQTGDPAPVVGDPEAPQAAPCQTLTGVPVLPGDIPERYRTTPPTGRGTWEYQVCAENAELAADIVAKHPGLANLKQYCDPDLAKPNCGLFVFWRPQIEQKPPAPIEVVGGYFEKFFVLAPHMASSPDPRAAYGIITNFPAWFWNTTPTTFPKVLPDLFFGGVAMAWHLRTRIQSGDGAEICDVGGLQQVGVVFDPNKYAPDQESLQCGYTYHNQGIYTVHACSQWLIVIANAVFVIAFPITVCNNRDVTVKESQVLTGGDVIRGRVPPAR